MVNNNNFVTETIANYITSAYNDSKNVTSAYNDSKNVTSAYNDSKNVTSAYNNGINHTSGYNDVVNYTSAYNNGINHTSAYHDSENDTSAYYDDIYNETSAYDDDVNDTSAYRGIPFSPETLFIIYLCILVVTVAAFIYGVTSWCTIKKFRHFRNFVLLSAVTAQMLYLLIFVLTDTITNYSIGPYLLFPVMLYFTISSECWLLVLCYMFYVDLVRIFRLDFRRRYLMTNVFAWGVPFITVFSYIVTGILLLQYYSIQIFTVPITKTLKLIPGSISFVFYVIVVYSLFYGMKVDMKSSNDKWRRLYISTLIFTLGNVTVIIYLLETLKIEIVAVRRAVEILEYVDEIALSVYLVIVKSNRVLWRQFLEKRKNDKINISYI